MLLDFFFNFSFLIVQFYEFISVDINRYVLLDISSISILLLNDSFDGKQILNSKNIPMWKFKEDQSISTSNYLSFIDTIEIDIIKIKKEFIGLCVGPSVFIRWYLNSGVLGWPLVIEPLQTNVL